ncbi:MAG: CHAT domain-containing protein, partial [Saprospiraceae bacterium]|nr:CHAT domain-containing protein [Saprospiraceae bacterium]
SIITSFYHYLNNGFKKDEALRNAKLDYLAYTSPSRVFPYFWAGFVPAGDMNSIFR